MYVYIQTDDCKKSMKGKVIYMKKSFNFKKTAVLLLAGSLLVATACGKKSASDASVAQPETGEYTFAYPEGWTVTENTGLYSISAPVEAASGNVAGANISVMNFEMKGDEYKYENFAVEETTDWRPELIAKYTDDYMSKLSQEFGTLEIMSEPADFDVGEMKARSVQYTIKDSFTDELFFYESAFVLVPLEDAPVCYIITYTANGEENFNTHHGALQKVLASFTFEYRQD